MSRLPIADDLMVELPDFSWSLERYHAAIEKGVLNKYDKVELLFGKLVPMSPIGVQHDKIVKKINRLFSKRFPEDQYNIGIQGPITLVDDSEPEPDAYLAKGPLEEYDHHPYPTDLLVVIEVSDSTLKKDRGIKLVSYAVAGIEEYWIINVYKRQLERHTGPQPEHGSYGRKEVFEEGDRFTSLYLGEFAVAELLV